MASQQFGVEIKQLGAFRFVRVSLQPPLLYCGAELKLQFIWPFSDDGVQVGLLRSSQQMLNGKPQQVIITLQVKNPPQVASYPIFPYACPRSLAETKCSSGLRGLRVMMSTSASSQAKESAGQISVPTQITNIKIFERGRGICTTTKATKGHISVMFEVSKYTIVFFKLSKIFRPYYTPSTIEAKSSFNRIMSAASFVTSEPEIPIEIPISPCLIAGLSFTPSPVTPTINPNL